MVNRNDLTVSLTNILFTIKDNMYMARPEIPQNYKI